MFSESDGYERFMGRWSRRLAPLFVTSPASPREIAYSTSGAAPARCPLPPRRSTVQVTGVERSAAYVRERARARERPIRGRRRHRAAVPSDGFDRTLSMLVLNFIADPAAAVHEMERVTRPGGVVAAAVWDYGDGMQMLRTFWDRAVALDSDAAPRDERDMPLSAPRVARGALAYTRDCRMLTSRRDDRDGVRIVRRLLAAVPRRPGPGRCLHGWIGRIGPARIGIRLREHLGDTDLPSRPARGRSAAASFDRLAEEQAILRFFADVRQHGVGPAVLRRPGRCFPAVAPTPCCRRDNRPSPGTRSGRAGPSRAAAAPPRT